MSQDTVNKSEMHDLDLEAAIEGFYLISSQISSNLEASSALESIAEAMDLDEDRQLTALEAKIATESINSLYRSIGIPGKTYTSLESFSTVVDTVRDTAAKIWQAVKKTFLRLMSFISNLLFGLKAKAERLSDKLKGIKDKAKSNNVSQEDIHSGRSMGMDRILSQTKDIRPFRDIENNIYKAVMEVIGTLDDLFLWIKTSLLRDFSSDIERFNSLTSQSYFKELNTKNLDNLICGAGFVNSPIPMNLFTKKRSSMEQEAFVFELPIGGNDVIKITRVSDATMDAASVVLNDSIVTKLTLQHREEYPRDPIEPTKDQIVRLCEEGENLLSICVTTMGDFDRDVEKLKKIFDRFSKDVETTYRDEDSVKFAKHRVIGVKHFLNALNNNYEHLIVRVTDLTLKKLDKLAYLTHSFQA